MSSLGFSITPSLDGYVAGPRQSVTHPLGEGGEDLHKWAFAARTFGELHGRQTAYECIRVVSPPWVSHFKYRRKP